VVQLKPKNPFPELFSEDEARRINEMRFRLTKVLKEFNMKNSKYKAKLSLHTCFPYHCKVVVYNVELIDSKRRVLAYTTFRWNLRTNTKYYLSTNANDVTTLEDTLNITFLTAKLAKEFFMGDVLEALDVERIVRHVREDREAR
jgi:hypothetical protein